MPLIEGDFAELLQRRRERPPGRGRSARPCAEAFDDGDRRRARLSGNPGERRSDPRDRRGRAGRGRDRIPCRHRAQRRRPRRQGRPGARRHRGRRHLRQRPGARLSGGRPDRLRRRLPPPRHRLARAGAGRAHERPCGAISGRCSRLAWWSAASPGIGRLPPPRPERALALGDRHRASIAGGDRPVAWPARRRAAPDDQRRARRPGDARLLRDDAKWRRTCIAARSPATWSWPARPTISSAASWCGRSTRSPASAAPAGPTRPAAPPLIVEAAAVALLGFLFGLLLAYLVELRRRYNAQWTW